MGGVTGDRCFFYGRGSPLFLVDLFACLSLLCKVFRIKSCLVLNLLLPLVGKMKVS